MPKLGPIYAPGDEDGNDLQVACFEGHEKLVQMLLDKGADVNPAGGLYDNPLQTASLRGHEKIVQMLLDKGADVNAQGGRYGNALQAALLRGHEKIVQILLNKGVNVNAEGGLYGNALQAASLTYFGDHKKIIQILLNKGADVNAQGGPYGNPLQAASFNSSEKIVQMLLDKGADVNAQGGRYGNALQAAVLRGHENIVRMLLDKGADINAEGGPYSNALYAALSEGQEKIIQILLNKLADVNKRKDENSNALQAASLEGHEKIVQILLNKGVDVNTQGGRYSNALQAASLRGHENIVQILLDQGADINAEGGLYGNALYAASLEGHKKIVQILLNRGADINKLKDKDSNALQAASLEGHEKIVQILLYKGADINAQGGRYSNALQAASLRGHEKIVQMLLNNGADINAQGGRYGNALQAASLRGHEKTVQVLIHKGADVNAQGGRYGNALHAASLKGHDRIVQVLLKQGAIANAQCRFRCQWEVPAVYEKMRQAPSPVSGIGILDLLSKFIILTGDGEAFECSTCVSFLLKRWPDAGLDALRIMSKGIEKLLLQDTMPLDLLKQKRNTTRDLGVKGVVLQRSTTEEIEVMFLTHCPNQTELIEAMEWISIAMRQTPATSTATNPTIFRSSSVKLTSTHQYGFNADHEVISELQSLKEWYPTTLSAGSSCWAKLFRTGIIAWHHLQRDWGKGLELSFELMVHLSTVENYCQLENGTILHGFMTALIPVKWEEKRRRIQWHFEVVENPLDGFLRPAELQATKQSWVKLQDYSKLSDFQCFVGWFDMAHILLGTRELVEVDAGMTWSGTKECRQTLRHTGFEAGVQLALSASPINIAPQLIGTWEFVSNVQMYTPTQQYRQTLHSSRRKVALVIDSHTKQAWLVPMLSLILHLCHIYFKDTTRIRPVENRIPFAEPGPDGFQAVLDAIEMKGDVVVLGDPGEPDTETLRQLFLRIHTSLASTAQTRREPKRSSVFATELMAIIDPPIQGSALREIDTSGSESLVGSWEAIVKHVGVVGVCARLGQAIRPRYFQRWPVAVPTTSGTGIASWV
ncbi:hypothetical protein EsH8_VII_000610 [Colletotrichum jinshuiense]